MIAFNAHNVEAVREALGCSLTEAQRLLRGYRDERTKLRDEFAAKALQGIIASDRKTDAIKINKNAFEAYQYADAMLTERERRDG